VFICCQVSLRRNLKNVINQRQRNKAVRGGLLS
jgi:hypothetical protein